MGERDNETYGEKLEKLEKISRYTNLIVNSAISKNEEHMKDYLRRLREYSDEVPILYTLCENLTDLAQDVMAKRALKKSKIKKMLEDGDSSSPKSGEGK